RSAESRAGTGTHGGPEVDRWGEAVDEPGSVTIARGRVDAAGKSRCPQAGDGALSERSHRRCWSSPWRSRRPASLSTLLQHPRGNQSHDRGDQEIHDARRVIPVTTAARQTATLRTGHHN